MNTDNYYLDQPQAPTAEPSQFSDSQINTPRRIRTLYKIAEEQKTGDDDNGKM